MEEQAMQILGVSLPFGISLLVGFLCGWVSFLVLPSGGALDSEAMVSAEVGDVKAKGRGGEKDEKGNREGNDDARGKQINRQNVVDEVKSRKWSSSPSLTRECDSEGSPSAHSGGNGGAPCNEAKVSEMANGMDTSGNNNNNNNNNNKSNNVGDTSAFSSASSQNFNHFVDATHFATRRVGLPHSRNPTEEDYINCGLDVGVYFGRVGLPHSRNPNTRT
jgi:hypothetical protein